MKSWWMDLSGRERRLLQGAALILLILGGWQFILRPLLDYRAEQMAVRQSALTTLEEIEGLAADVLALRARQKSMAPLAGKGNATADPVRSIISRTASEKGLSMTRLMPEEDGGVTIWFDQISSPQLFSWIADLQTEHGIRVMRASLSDNREQAGIRAQIRLQKGAF
ncbi:hypothetical protein JCM17846_19380 [Iodidimonas nitroreducens]|uniref:General secretion pathway protein M n=1 Tax=Iodidimonas nitroreducens TaxID=1236968 RepID=A0A5A7NBD1_9PROT|nr:type II secretion system protein M [Iodidimonas nitroreducens]GAK33155.1 type II secretion system protein M [alpha proteobacterium Q-1]GER04256.1 hypothetical protein JCM17846_19380 [Iodidimonas nitroreducens]